MLIGISLQFPTNSSKNITFTHLKVMTNIAIKMQVVTGIYSSDLSI